MQEEKETTLTLELPPEVEGALENEARRKGKTPEQIILEDLRERYPSPALRQNKMQALFAQWDAEDATSDPAEIERRNQEWESTKTALEANRFSLEGRTDFHALLGESEEEAAEGTA